MQYIYTALTLMDVLGVFTPENRSRTPKIDKGDVQVRPGIKGIRRQSKHRTYICPLEIVCNYLKTLCIVFYEVSIMDSGSYQLVDLSQSRSRMRTPPTPRFDT